MGYDGWVKVGTELDTKKFDKQIEEVEGKLEEIDVMLSHPKQFELTDADIVNLQLQAEKLNNKLIKLNEEKQKLDKSGLPSFKNIMDDINKSTSNVIAKVGRWALAVFGIRGAYMAVRNAINIIAQDDEKLASDIEYMKRALAYTIEPIVRGIVNLMQQLMLYIAYIVKAWTGRDIFASANKSLKNANKNAQKLSKTLAGFDEMNVISDNSSSGGVGTAGMDLSSIQGEVPSWIQWIADNKESVLGVISGLIAGVVALKLKFEGIKALGIGVIIAGIVLLIQDIIDFINDPSWENFTAILGDIAIVIGGIMLAMGNWWGLLVLIIGAIVKLVAENWDAIKEILGKVGTWIYDHIIKPVGDFFVGLWDGIVNGVKTAVKWVKDAFSSVVSFFSNLISKIVNLFKKIGTKVGNAIGSAFKTVINGVLKAIESILNFPIKSINKLINVINKIPGINLGTLPTFELPRLAVGGIVNMPGRGIMYGGANIGERGAEGVIPLTNSQMMAQLGEAIGRYVTINANITNTMNGRIISRELQKVNNNSDFAFNR